LKETADLEKSDPGGAKGSPQGRERMVKLDAFKVDGINVH